MFAFSKTEYNFLGMVLCGLLFYYLNFRLVKNCYSAEYHPNMVKSVRFKGTAVIMPIFFPTKYFKQGKELHGFFVTVAALIFMIGFFNFLILVLT